MKARIYVINNKNENWFDEAIVFADNISNTAYMPSIEAVKMCDEREFVKLMVNNVYKI